MKEVKYIPGDLVMIDNDVCQVKGVRKRNGLIQNVVEAKVINHTENIVRAVDESSITPIPLTPAILEANGWKLTQQGIDDEKFEYLKYERATYPTLMFYPKTNGQKMSVSAFIYNTLITDDLVYCHQLQHLLFGLGLDSSLKV